MQRWFLQTCFALAVCAPNATAGEPFKYPEGKHGKGELRYVNGLPVLTVAGTPEEIAEQVTALGVKPAERLLQYPKDVVRAYFPGNIPGIKRETGVDIAWRALLAMGETLVPNFPPDHRREFDAMLKAHGGPRELLLAANTMFDIKKVFNHNTVFFGCSSLQVAKERSLTGQPFVGRNLDFPTMGYLQEYSLVTIYRPTGKRPFVALGFPGLIGVISGMNDAGLSVAVLEVYDAKDGSNRYQAGEPYAMTYRRILEECSTVDEARKLLEATKRTTMCNLAVCDPKGGGFFEITPKSVVYRQAEDGVCACTNHFNSPELARRDQNNLFDTMERYEKLAKAKDLPKLSITDVAVKLHDANLGDATFQTMIFEPATLKLHLALAPCPSSQHKLKELDLRPYFKK